MNAREGGVSGLLVLRLWVEPDGQLRVRATGATELTSERTTTYASSRAEVLAVVANWLDELAPAEPR